MIFSLAICLPSAYPVRAVVNSENQNGSKMTGYPQVSYCDLISHPQEYDGKQVAVRASYRYGFEFQEMFCLKCRGQGKTWLEFGFEAAPNVRRALRKAPNDHGTVNAVFYGTFRGRRGPYGDGGYAYKLDLEFLKDVKVVYREGMAPDLLPSNVQKQLCQE